MSITSISVSVSHASNDILYSDPLELVDVEMILHTVRINPRLGGLIGVASPNNKGLLSNNESYSYTEPTKVAVLTFNIHHYNAVALRVVGTIEFSGIADIYIKNNADEIGNPVVTYIYKSGNGLKVYKDGKKLYIAAESNNTYLAANIQVISKTYSLQNTNPSYQLSFISVAEFNSIKDNLIEATYRTLT